MIIDSINGIKIYLPISSKLIDNSFVRYNNATNYKPNHLLYKYYYVCKLGKQRAPICLFRASWGLENIGIFFRLNKKFLVWGWGREDTERYRGNSINSIRASSFMIQGDRKDKLSEKKNQLASRYVEQVSAAVFCKRTWWPALVALQALPSVQIKPAGAARDRGLINEGIWWCDSRTLFDKQVVRWG